MAVPTFENPLIPHARMRALLRALVEARALSARLPGKPALPKGLEACWVATAIDLRPTDLTSSPAGSASLIPYLREVGQRTGLQSPTRRAAARVLGETPDPFSGTPCERLLCAIGAAMALQAAGEEGVVIAYSTADALKPAEWKRIFTFAAAGAYPLILMVLPAATRKQAPDLSRLAAKMPGDGLPVIPVEATDVVALYRVAQESILRARAGGGPAVIEAVPTRSDPIAILAAQLAAKGIGNPRWIAALEPAFLRLLPPGRPRA